MGNKETKTLVKNKFIPCKIVEAIRVLWLKIKKIVIKINKQIVKLMIFSFIFTPISWYNLIGDRCV